MSVSWELFIGPFSGVLLAFGIARAYDTYKNHREKQKLCRSLKRELEDCRDRLAGKEAMARLVPTDIWQSAIASGKVLLLSHEEQEKLGRMYHGLSNHNFDSKKLWNVSVIAKTERDLSSDTPAKITWASLSAHQRKAEKTLKSQVNELLQEKCVPRGTNA